MNAFPKDFWKDSQTELEFIPSTILPKGLSLTAIQFWIFKINRVLLVHVPRGWEIIAGHIEQGEKPEDAAKREAFEEAGVIINSLNLIGYIKATSKQENKLNKKYPINSGIPVFVSNDFLLNSSVKLNHESINRKFVPISKLDENLALSKMMKSIMHYAFKIISPVF